MLNNKKGAALLQVLLVTAVLAGMATMLLRASLSRTTTARQTRRTVSAKLLVNACMAEVNTLWNNKTPEAFANDMRQCIMYCEDGIVSGGCSKPQYEYTCNDISLEGLGTYTVTAVMEQNSSPNADGQCRMDFVIDDDKGSSSTSVEL